MNKRNSKKNVEERIPVTVLTGFLGSGKTTLLNYILNENHGKRIAVIENEFGEVGVDDQLVDKKFFEDENIVEMKNGCICCTVRQDLVVILQNLIKKREKFDYILIETTGLADPAPVAQTFFMDEKIGKNFYLDAIITVVDAKHLEIHLDDEKEEGVENECKEQIAFADKIILNKTDLVEKSYLDHIKKRIKEINASVEVIETTFSKIDIEKIMGIRAFDLSTVLEVEPDFLKNTEHQHDKSVSSFGMEFIGDLHRFKLDRWIDELLINKGNDLFRYKGILSVKGENRKYIFQGIHMLFMDTPGTKWSKEQERINKICFIGRNLDKKILREGINSCIVTDPLRFQIGDKVDCNMGKDIWQEGTVIKLWDDGNAYRVKLLDGMEVWAAIDEDSFITKAE